MEALPRRAVALHESVDTRVAFSGVRLFRLRIRGDIHIKRDAALSCITWQTFGRLRQASAAD